MRRGIQYKKLPRSGWRFKTRGWKYILTETYACGIEVMPDAGASSAEDPWIHLSASGEITIREGYAWDGPSGPTVDTQTFMRGSLVHDALYQLMREEKLAKLWRKGADLALYRICLEDGMHQVRARWVYWAVRMFGASHVKG